MPRRAWALVVTVAAAAAVTLVVVATGAAAQTSDGFVPCTPADATCWPTAADVAALTAALSTLPASLRNASWTSPTMPFPAAVPISSENNQPFYGINSAQLFAPLYVRNADDLRGVCWLPSSNPFFTSMCFPGIVNNPSDPRLPAFIALPLDVDQVRAVVNFARVHRLCVAVAGTGHDFMARHTCNSVDSSILIRTTFIKGASFSPDTNTIKFGAGFTFDEAHAAAARVNRVVPSGWANTVGLGWYLAGGHGPHGNFLGMGSDNLVAAEVVLANGTAVNASATTNADLWWALRGGGGSTWGVITSITVQAYPIPQGGFTRVTASMVGELCNTDAGSAKLSGAINAIAAWIQTLGPKWSGLWFTTPYVDSVSACRTSWSVNIMYVFQGGPTDATFVADTSALSAGLNAVQSGFGTLTTVNVANFSAAMRAQSVETIIPVGWIGPSGGASGFAGGLPSVLVQRDKLASSALQAHILARAKDCVAPTRQCYRLEVYDDLTGHVGAPQAANVSVNPLMRTALVHYLSAGWPAATQQTFYDLGDASYFSESALVLSTWQQRYWGSNYAALLAVKRKYDPGNLFWCRHCVGDVRNSTFVFPPSPSSGSRKVVAVGKGLAVVSVVVVTVLGVFAW